MSQARSQTRQLVMDRRPRHAQNMLPWRADRIAAFVSDNGVWLRAVRIDNDEPQGVISVRHPITSYFVASVLGTHFPVFSLYAE
jgi:hypothetical protein